MSSQANKKKKKKMRNKNQEEEEEQLFDIRSYQQLKAKTKPSAQQEQMTPKSKRKKTKTLTTDTPKGNNKGQKVPATPPSAKSASQKSSLRGSSSGAKSKAKASATTTTPSRSPFLSKNPSPSPSSSQHQRSFFSPQATPPSNSNKKKPFSSSFLHRRSSANFSPSSAAASPSFSATPSKKRGQLLFQRVSNRGRPFSNSGFGQSVRLSTAEMSKRTRTVDVCLGGRGLAVADVEAFVGWLQKSMPLIYAASFGSSSSSSSSSSASSASSASFSSSLSSSTVEVAAGTVTEEEKKKQAYNSEEENKMHEAKTFETKGDSTSEEDLEDAVDEEEEDEEEADKGINVESSDGEAESERTEEDIETEDEGIASRDESGTQEEDTEDAVANEEEEKEIANDLSEEVAREAKETEPNEELREKEVLHQPQTQQQKNTSSKNRILLFNLHFQENRLEDNAVKLLCEYFLSQHKEGVATVRRFYFYRNRIRDDGAKAIASYVRQVAGELSELHLSHNRITFEGIRELLVAVKQSGEDQKKPQKSPLWMRVEYNYIAVKKMEEFLRKENVLFCAAKQRKFCSTGRCIEKKVPQVHLYVYELQYLPAEESSRLVDAKRAVSIAREKQRMKKEQQVKLPERQQAEVEGAESQTEYEPSGGFALLNEFPTYLFLDTNAVIHMMMPQEWNRLINSNRPIMNETADGEIEEVDDGGRGEDEGFFFKNLVKKAQRREFGECFENPADRVTLIITDTVMSELDHIKTTKPHLSRCIRQLQSETGYLAQSVHLGFVEMLGAHQGEHLVSFGDRQIVEQEEDDKLSGKGGHSSRNDRRIIDVALLWNTEIGVTGNVVLITGDKGAAETAKRHNLPAASWRDLNENLLKKEKEKNESKEEKKLWTATRIKRCIPRALYYGGKMMAEAPVRSSKSIFQELSCAVTLTDRLAEALRFVLAENQEMKRRSEKEKEVVGEEYEGKEGMLFEELIREAVESKVRWEQLIQQQRVGPYLLTQSSSSSSLSSQTTASSSTEEKQQQATEGAIVQEDVATTVTTVAVQEILKGNKEGAEGNEDRQLEQAKQEEEKNEQRGDQEIEDGKEQEGKKERKDERHDEQEEDENKGEDGKDDSKEERHGEEGTKEEEIQKEVRQEQTEGTTATKEQAEYPAVIKSVPLFEAVEPKEHTSVQEQESKEPPSSLQVPNDELPSPPSTSSHSSED